MQDPTGRGETLHELQSGRPVDISLVLALHREGPLLLPTMQSLKDALNFAQAHGVNPELVIVLDDADRNTMEHLARAGLSSVEDLRVVEGRLTSLGASRNVGADAARGDWVCFADGDDLVSYNLLSAFHSAAERAGDKTILMPQWLLTFGIRHRIGLVLPLSEIGPLNLLSSNPFVSRVCTRKALIAAIPFTSARTDDAYAFEDWRHHCETIARGCDLTTVPDTILFYRMREDGLNATAEKSSRATAPSKLFEPDVFLARCASDYAAYRSGCTRPTHQDVARSFGSQVQVPLVRAATAIESSIEPSAYDPDEAFTSVSPYHKSVGALYYDICKNLTPRVFSRVEIGDARASPAASAAAGATLRIEAMSVADAPFAHVGGIATAGRPVIVRLGHDNAACEMLCLKMIQAFGPEAEISTDSSPLGSALLKRFGDALRRTHAIVND